MSRLEAALITAILGTFAAVSASALKASEDLGCDRPDRLAAATASDGESFSHLIGVAQ